MKKFTTSSIFVVAYFSLGGFICGYALSVIAGAAPVIVKNFSLSTEQISTIMGLILFGGLVAKAILIFNDYFERKILLIVNLLLYILGILIFTHASSYGTLFLGRFLQGGAVIMGTVTFTVYLSEIAPTKKRGAMITSFQLAWTAGMFVANIVNLHMLETNNWQIMFNGILFIPILLLISSFFLPKSPRWLIMKGRISEAQSIITSINKHLSSEELEKELTLLLNKEKIEWIHSFKLIFHYLKPILLVCAVFTLTQLCGINAIMQTSVILLKECGVKSNFIALFGTVLISGINFLMTIGTIIYVDRLGRKKLLKIGTFGYFICMILLSTLIWFLPKEELAGWISLCMIICGIGFLAFGPNGVVYVIIAELLPTPVRSLGLIIGGLCSVLVGTIFVSKFLVIGSILGYPALFLMISIFSLVYFIFSIKLLPETKGKTLEEIETDIT